MGFFCSLKFVSEKSMKNIKVVFSEELNMKLRRKRISSLNLPGKYFQCSIPVFFILFLLNAFSGKAQVITLKQAVETALNNYGTIKAKANYLRSSQASAREASSEY